MTWKYSQRTKNSIDKVFSDLSKYFDEVVQSFSSVNEKINYLDSLSSNEDYQRLSDKAARNIVELQSKDSARTWREAARKSTNAREIYQFLRAELSKNQRFNNLIFKTSEQIRTLPSHVATRVVKKVEELTLKGLRSGEIATEIQREIKGYSRASALLIARTQVSKTLSTIQKIRSESLGIKAYIWRTVGGPRVRDSHRHMEGVICFFNEPPSPEALIGMPTQGFYEPGGIYNCRCYMEPLISVDQVTWPHKVYYRGRIKRYNKREFQKILLQN